MTNTSFQVKKFIANDITTAFQMVKNELGQNAVILSNDQIDGKIHILAAPQERAVAGETAPFHDHAQQTASALMQLKKNKERKTSHDNAFYHYEEIASPPQDFTDKIISSRSHEGKKRVEVDTMNDLKAEMMAIRKMMAVSYASQSWETFQQENINQAIIYRKLIAIGFEPAVVNDIVQNLPSEMNFDDAWINVLNQLVHKIKLYKDKKRLKKINFTIGPSGAGKTTILTKHLMEHVDEKNAHQFAVIFVNKNKLTALTETQIFQNVFNIACFYVETIDELEAAFSECHDKKRVYVDLPAINLIDKEQNYYLDFIKAHQADAAIFAVLPANVGVHYLQGLDDMIGGMAFSALSITKIDEYENYAPCVNYAIDKSIPIAYLNLSPILTEALIEANYSLIMKDLLIILNKQSFNHIAIDEKMANYLMEKMTNELASKEKSKQSA